MGNKKCKRYVLFLHTQSRKSITYEDQRQFTEKDFFAKVINHQLQKKSSFKFQCIVKNNHQLIVFLSDNKQSSVKCWKYSTNSSEEVFKETHVLRREGNWQISQQTQCENSETKSMMFINVMMERKPYSSERSQLLCRLLNVAQEA